MVVERDIPGMEVIKGAFTSLTGVLSGGTSTSDARAKLRTLRGTFQAGRTLAALPRPWRVFAGVDVGGEKADYAAVGPRGVFSIEVKFCDGPVAANARGLFIAGIRNKGPVERALRRAGLLEDLLGVHVEAVLAVAGSDLTGDSVDGLPVVLLAELPDFLLSDDRPRIGWDAASAIFATLEARTR